MVEGRIPAQVDLLVSTPGINLCGSTNHEVNNTAVNAENQPSRDKKPRLPGNGCNHDRNNPNFWTPPKHCETRSIIIETLLEKLERAYFDPRHYFKEGQHRNNKQIKSERRHIIIDVLRLAIYYMHDETLRIGRKVSNTQWDDLSVKKIAKRLNVSFDRVKDALTDIYKCGYIFSKRQYKTTPEGKKVWLPSMRVLTPKLFIDLGIKYEKIFKLKQYKEEQRLKKEMKVDKKESRVAQDFIKSCFATTQKHKPRIEIPSQSETLKTESTTTERSKTASEWLKSITRSLKPSPS